jgi:hypothetical protein
MFSHSLKLDGLRNASDVHKVIDSHEWVLEKSDPYNLGGTIVTLRCSKCNAEWSSVFLPFHDDNGSGKAMEKC